MKPAYTQHLTRNGTHALPPCSQTRTQLSLSVRPQALPAERIMTISFVF